MSVWMTVNACIRYHYNEKGKVNAPVEDGRLGTMHGCRDESIYDD